ncbi:thioredoxin family protein [Chitinophaga qingshengii]|uniref:Thioredoxin family protein n=1 Tax=Chitinophaga qingshengii TaxID=1569794 RepID=A0ABR7TR02_9BACT|nr:thioredoxin family protein [Chitinophaga qingshengii]MBC9932916.1 thioredoxin family protein [Chitinophaga qingshengii]
METAIKYFTGQQAEAAFELAKTTQRPLLIDIWADNCKGCHKMDTVTYEAEQVREYLEDHYVLVKLNVKEVTKAFTTKYLPHSLVWTPAFFMYAPDGTILREATGYLPPHQFLAELTIGRALLEMRRGKPAAAGILLATLAAETKHPAQHQEVLYWQGVMAFFAGGKSFEALVPYWRELRETYPESLWAERADTFPA